MEGTTSCSRLAGKGAKTEVRSPTGLAWRSSATRLLEAWGMLVQRQPAPAGRDLDAPAEPVVTDCFTIGSGEVPELPWRRAQTPTGHPSLPGRVRFKSPERLQSHWHEPRPDGVPHAPIVSPTRRLRRLHESNGRARQTGVDPCPAESARLCGFAR